MNNFIKLNPISTKSNSELSGWKRNREKLYESDDEWEEYIENSTEKKSNDFEYKKYIKNKMLVFSSGRNGIE